MMQSEQTKECCDDMRWCVCVCCACVCCVCVLCVCVPCVCVVCVCAVCCVCVVCVVCACVVCVCVCVYSCTSLTVMSFSWTMRINYLQQEAKSKRINDAQILALL